MWGSSVASGVVAGFLAVAALEHGWLKGQAQAVAGHWQALRQAEDDLQRERASMCAGFALILLGIECVAICLLLVALYAWPVLGTPLMTLAQAQHALVFSACAAAVLAWVRRRSGYSSMERLMHRIVLGPRVVRQATLDLAISRAGRLPGDAAPVFVVGLARSGTTMLMRLLSSTGAFAVQTYRDMPWVLAPRPAGQRSVPGSAQSARGRAHGDAILVDVDSPEAFEEVFWSTVVPYQVADGWLTATAPGPEAMGAFAAFRSLVVMAHGGGALRYLSKNNNNLLRIGALAAVPGANVVVPFRSPFAAARSLLRMQGRFVALQREDPFVRTYMDLLIHREFGNGLALLGVARGRMNLVFDPGSASCWLEYWCVVHEWLLEQHARDVTWVDFDRLRADPGKVLASLLARLGVGAEAALAVAGLLPPVGDVDAGAPEQFEAGLRERASRVHSRLQEASRAA